MSSSETVQIDVNEELNFLDDLLNNLEDMDAALTKCYDFVLESLDLLEKHLKNLSKTRSSAGK